MTRLFASGIACAAAVTVSLSAQNPPQQPATPAGAAQDHAAHGELVTAEGCLYKEVNVPGRVPPEAEQPRVNRDNDYVLVNVKMVKGAAPAMASRPNSADAPTGTSGIVTSGPMFKIEEIDLGELESHAGTRVQIDGRFQHLDRGDNVVSPGTELVKLRGTAMRKVAGECPAK